MRELIGALIVVNGIAIAGFLLREKTVDWKGFLAVAGVAIFAGIVVANLPYVTQLAGGKSGVTVSIQRQVEHVDTKAKEVEATASEVRDLKDQVKLLVQNANSTNDKIADSEKRVAALVQNADKVKGEVETINTQVAQASRDVKMTEANVIAMRNDVQQALRSIFEANAYAIGTRNLFPPPPEIGKEIDRHLNILATFAYPDPAERSAVIQHLMSVIKNTQSPPPSSK